MVGTGDPSLKRDLRLVSVLCSAHRIEHRRLSALLAVAYCVRSGATLEDTGTRQQVSDRMVRGRVGDFILDQVNFLWMTS